jgi:16S rRNA (guanine(966)-N(2))-methyltransferase RsmD
MRVTGGKYRNRRLHPPREMEARPTTDFAKEGLFNILRHNYPLEGIHVLDLFAGTGGISLEFLSHGAEKVVAVEQDRALCDFMSRTARDLGETGWHVVRGDAYAFLGGHRGRYDVVFADPPFHDERVAGLPTLVFQADILDPDGLLIVEHSSRTSLADQPGFLRERTYGALTFSLFRQPAHEPSAP